MGHPAFYKNLEHALRERGVSSPATFLKRRERIEKRLVSILQSHGVDAPRVGVALFNRRFEILYNSPAEKKEMLNALLGMAGISANESASLTLADGGETFEIRLQQHY